MADGSVINYISRSVLLNRFIELLITVCSYSTGSYTAALSGRQITIYVDSKPQLKAFCLEHTDYIAHGKLFAVSFSENYSQAIFLIDPEIFELNHPVLIDIALSMIATIKYPMLVAAENWSTAHCALVEINGKGALICAPGGTGKSTCAARLPAPHWALAEDCALVMQAGDAFIAQSMPAWSLVTSEHKKVDDIRFDCNATIELAGVFFLEQGTDDSVERLSDAVALGYLNSSFNDHLRWFLTHLAGEQAQGLRLNVFELAEQLIATLPAYRLSATIDGNFWDVMDEVLK
ncbi:MAG: hypothetical protein L3J71_11335 [Victivallaceae bacterium]|nr:hypothetical protein [Victivallaceae bacterium]